MSNTTAVKATGCKLERIVPILNVKNLAASVDYYVNVLSFTKDWDWGDPPNFAGVSRDDCSIMLCEGGQGSAGTWIWIGVEDAETFYAEYKACGAAIHQTPTNYPWAYEFKIEDPDGHVLRIGSSPKADQPFVE